MKQKMSKKRVTRDDRSGEDRISSLPDHLLCQILSKLTTKYAVRTSVLSKRWKSMWLSVPILDLDKAEIHRGYIDAVESFVNGFLDISREKSCIDKLKLDYEWDDEDDKSYITRWIHNAVIRKLQNLDINSRANVIWRSRGCLVLPLSLNTCETLVYLKLSFVSFADCEHVSLPCLKTMVLVWNIYPNDAFLEKLISSCPVLEDLEIERDDHIESQNTATVSRVRSQSLKSLMLVLSGDKFKDAGDLEVVIDAPRLNYLCLTDDKSTSFLISNLSSSAEVDIDVTFALEIISAANVSSKKSVVRKFFTGLSSVRDMTISPKTMKIIFQLLKHESLPQFPYMTQLNVESSDYDLEMLPNILENCPNIKSFVLNLELEDFEKNEVFTLPSSVPECLRLSLEYIEMKGSISGAEAEMKLVQYFLESSAVLKKFTLRLGPKRVKKGTIILTELLRLRRCSPYCEVVVELEGQGE